MNWRSTQTNEWSEHSSRRYPEATAPHIRDGAAVCLYRYCLHDINTQEVSRRLLGPHTMYHEVGSCIDEVTTHGMCAAAYCI